MKRCTNTMSAIVLVVVGMLFFCGSSLASSDIGHDYCPWSSRGCLVVSPPILSVDNDTRDNLLRLTAERSTFKLPIQSDTIDVTRSRNFYFAPHMKEWLAISRTDDTPLNQREVAVLACEKAVNDKANQLGIAIEKLGMIKNKEVELTERHVSNTLCSVEQFYTALLADESVVPEQRYSLAMARLDIDGSAEAQRKIENVSYPENSTAQAFHRYLLAANQFYQGNYSSAQIHFIELTESRQSWLAETATYMLIRSALNQSSAKASDHYGEFDIDKIDKDAALQALSRAQQYLHQYPNGVYASSADGLLRRINWYLKNWDSLAWQAEQALMRVETVDALIALIEESDNKLLDNYWLRSGSGFLYASKAPLLTFTKTLLLMRNSGYDAEYFQYITIDYLNKIKPIFETSHTLPLWQYLTLMLAKQQKEYATVLSGIVPADYLPEHDILAFSHQVLYGEVLMAQENWSSAGVHWLRLLNLTKNQEQRQFLQAMLAAVRVASDHPEQIFSPNSPITNLRYRSAVLKKIASPALLRQRVVEGMNNEEKTIALHTLLVKDLADGRYSEWLQDNELMRYIDPPVRDEAFKDVNVTIFNWTGEETAKGYHCVSLRETVIALKINKEDAHALNCLGEFFRTSYAHIDTWDEDVGNLALNTVIATAVGTTDDTDNLPDRQSLYLRVIQNKRAEPEDKSYALFRAIMCYATSGNNHCGGKSVDVKVRKAWFNELKTNYRNGIWAKRLKYYW